MTDRTDGEPKDTADTRIIRDGDVFRWSWKRPERAMPYHCKSQIAVVKDNILFDTYWGASGGGITFHTDDAIRMLDMEFLGNLHDYNKTDERYSAYYAPEDCMDLNHANSSCGNFYVRKEAQRSAEQMRETALQRRDKAIRDILAASEQVRRMDGILHQIELGELGDVYF